MSQLRVPVARPERREGGRHGRPGARSLPSTGRANTPVPPDARIRPRLLRTAVLPTTVAALSGAVAVVLLLRSASAEPTSEVWAALVGTALLAFAAVAAAALGAERTAKSVLDRCAELRRASARGQDDLRAAVERIGRGERVSGRGGPPPPTVPGGDEFDLLAEELGRSRAAAIGAVVQASRLSTSVGNEQKVEVFVNLARRLQSLVHREIQLLDDLENEVEDPELLKGLFHVDHLATRIRRHAENLAVLGGAVSRRQWSKPVTTTEVLRAAIAEVEQYPRIKLVPPIDGSVRGHAVADVIHLLAELVENATLFSSPHTQVLLRAQRVTAGLAIEVEDRGLGMPLDEQQRMNELLIDPDQVNVARLLQDGRIGLFVVSALARRHGIAVRLQSNIYGGVQAVLILPQALLGSDRAELDSSQSSAAVPVPRPHQRIPSQPQPYETPPRPYPAHGDSVPLPVRDEHSDRRAPAGALPGAGHGERRHSAAGQGHTTQASADPSDGTIGGAANRPQLPRRRGQEHLVPQLRDLPGAPSTGEPALHDPGLMAAFRRGIGLAESQPVPLPAAQPDPRPAETGLSSAGPSKDRPADPLPEPRRDDIPLKE
ncbi:ATP-binding protein [Streptomyces sp. AK02-01A]|uniref:ATP-binding protein n=1 Tax=Streptomyces sp. AK02-01A TaxID=3028648 RepID=UPI00299FC3AF|nr:ATP-binding protein [Streptomyces sp. AK02-01A]MDX3855077.1 ATP-binding protein [Streptomyces sp. AK02-01A]